MPSETRKLNNRLDKVVRAYVMKRDRLICQVCGRKAEPPKTTSIMCWHGVVMHIYAKGGINSQFRWEPFNLLWVHNSHHIEFHGKGGLEAWFEQKFPQRFAYLHGFGKRESAAQSRQGKDTSKFAR